MQRSWWLRIVAVVGGILLAGLCIMLVATLAHRMLTEDGLFAAAVAGQLVGALVGGSAAVRLAGGPLYGWIVTGALALLSGINVASFPHPAWFIPAAIAALALGGWLASRTAPRARAAP